ncbi:hypothetical protein B0H14DRAFT_2664620 [Mycena olivaceomarginata]|nr:hypothetical protein B0H14DRAFT_2664620 [Mycena olivaceomarginata]
MSTPNYSALGFIHILASLDGPVLVVLMNRSKQRNSWIGAVADELQQVFDLADKDDRVRVVVLTAAHTAPAYCAGADISGGWDILWNAEEEKDGPRAHRDTQEESVWLRQIAAINGIIFFASTTTRYASRTNCKRIRATTRFTRYIH